MHLFCTAEFHLSMHFTFELEYSQPLDSYTNLLTNAVPEVTCLCAKWNISEVDVLLLSLAVVAALSPLGKQTHS